MKIRSFPGEIYIDISRRRSPLSMAISVDATRDETSLRGWALVQNGDECLPLSQDAVKNTMKERVTFFVTFSAKKGA